MLEIKKIKKLSLANIAALVWALFGFVISFGFSTYALVIVILEKQTAGRLPLFIATNLGLGFLVALTTAVLAGGLGWLLGIVVAAFYNFLAREIGGFQFDLGEDALQNQIIIKEEKKQDLFKY